MAQPPEYEKHWGIFSQRLKKRLIDGHKAYGDKSFELPIEKQIDEIQQELEDVCGWGLVLWGRLQKMRDGLSQAKQADPEGIHDHEMEQTGSV